MEHNDESVSLLELMSDLTELGVGGTLWEQLFNVLRGKPLEEQNKNALADILSFLEEIGGTFSEDFDPQHIVKEAGEIASRIEAYLETAQSEP